MGISDFIYDALSKPCDLIGYNVSRELAELYPSRTVVEGCEPNFDLESFGRDEQCSIVSVHAVHKQSKNRWKRVGEQVEVIRNGWLDVLWQGKLLEVLYLNYGDCWRRHWIIADDRATAESFFDAVCAWSCDVRGEIVVYKDGYFQKDKELFDSIKSSTFENLHLRASLKEELEGDFDQFLKSRELYERYNIPWKRGAIFIGPPGNGKTHTVKALVNQLAVPCIYVRSFKSEYGTEQENMSEVFERARITAPCIVVLEDLDAMLSDKTRSFFLNELDGFRVNSGVMVIATTNHPKKLDAAILERPSRFDRKYQFELPSADDRRIFIESWNRQMQSDARLSDQAITLLAGSTEGFSFAYLKELLLSSLVHWVSNERAQSMDQVAETQAAALRLQIIPKPTTETRSWRNFKLLKRTVVG